MIRMSIKDLENGKEDSESSEEVEPVISHLIKRTLTRKKYWKLPMNGS